ncbi:complexin-3 isoform X1 [Equus przewalskii]|uniref:Lectin, mannose binding 1 like n=2 Tax=Equus TaxID=9789 RepID=F7A668_HORSE
MAFMVKTMVGGQLKNLTGSLGGGEDKGDGDKSAAEAQGMSREEYEEYQKQLVEEKRGKRCEMCLLGCPQSHPISKTRPCPREGKDRPSRRPRGTYIRACRERHTDVPARRAPSSGGMERDAQFTQRKAERATLRSHFRDKYRLPKNETDESQIQMAGGDVELPRELAKMIEEDTEEEEEKASVLGQLASLPGLDLGSLKDKAQATLGDLKQSAEKCHIM